MDLVARKEDPKELSKPLDFPIGEHTSEDSYSVSVPTAAPDALCSNMQEDTTRGNRFPVGYSVVITVPVSAAVYLVNL